MSHEKRKMTHVNSQTVKLWEGIYPQESLIGFDQRSNMGKHSTSEKCQFLRRKRNKRKVKERLKIELNSGTYK